MWNTNVSFPSLFRIVLNYELWFFWQLRRSWKILESISGSWGKCWNSGKFPGYRLTQPILSNWFLTVASLPPNDIVTEPLLATVSSCSSVSVIKEMIYWQLNFWENFRIVRQWTRFKMSIIRLDVWCMDPNRMSMASIAVLNGRYLE